MDDIFIKMERSMLEAGKMTNNTEWVLKNFRIDQYTKEVSLREKNMEKEDFCGEMDPLMRVIFK